MIFLEVQSTADTKEIFFAPKLFLKTSKEVMLMAVLDLN